MNLVSEPLPGLKVIEPFIHRDSRGDFVKPFHGEQLAEFGIHIDIKEEFFSTSAKNVLRGLHFQMPPYEHQKLVYCISGSVLDVALDLRKGSTYGKAVGVELSSENHFVLSIPTGFAHGFLSLSDQACLVHKTDAVHACNHEAGILWNSFGFEWPVKVPYLSERDQKFPSLKDFKSPFAL
jgi:dTDP-4-dehydrorhamnose 3,5-epimerase